MSWPVCFVSQPKTAAELQMLLQESLTTSRTFLEIYVDALDTSAREQLPVLVREVASSVIITLRRPRFEPTLLSQAEHVLLLRTLSGSGVFVDLDIDHESELLNIVRAESLDLKVVASYHNYRETPPLEQLLEIVQRMRSLNPVVKKVATMCASDEHCLDLSRLIERCSIAGDLFVITGMGERGKPLRLAGALAGNCWTYVAKREEDATAPGMITDEQFHTIMSHLA